MSFASFTNGVMRDVTFRGARPTGVLTRHVLALPSSLFSLRVFWLRFVCPHLYLSSCMTASTPTWTQFVRVCMDNQPANVRLFVMHGGVETFVELVGSAFQHAHSLTASSSAAAPLAITGVDGDASGDGTGASPTGSSGSEEHFGSSTSNGQGGKVPRRERASDLSVALTCRELVVECISCLSSALEVRRG